MGASDSSSRMDGPKVLLVGDLSRAFLDTDAARRLPCQIHENMTDAIDAAAKNNFAAIAVVISGARAKLGTALRALRAASCGAKIVLLARMYEEPLAIQLVGSTSNGAALADDYLVCPIQADRFYESVVPTHPQRKVELIAPATVGRRMDTRIKRLEKLATEDDLTGLKNRRYIWEFARQIIEHAKKENGRVTLLIFDIDNFKHYNDVYGHSAGDEILKQAGVLMRRCCRAHDVVGRIGGDEFAAVFWDDPQRKTLEQQTERRSATVDHPKEAIFVAKRFRKELGKAELHLLGPEGKGVLTISGGLASFPRDGSTMQHLFQQADTALLDAKRSGKNRIYLVGTPKSDIADVE